MNSSFICVLAHSHMCSMLQHSTSSVVRAHLQDGRILHLASLLECVAVCLHVWMTASTCMLHTYVQAKQQLPLLTRACFTDLTCRASKPSQPWPCTRMMWRQLCVKTQRSAPSQHSCRRWLLVVLVYGRFLCLGHRHSFS